MIKRLKYEFIDLQGFVTVISDIHQGEGVRQTLHPDYLKGHPERSKGWDKAAWKPEDAPKQLIGQFDRSVVVTNFKAGIVKGYRHHRL